MYTMRIYVHRRPGALPPDSRNDPARIRPNGLRCLETGLRNCRYVRVVPFDDLPADDQYRWATLTLATLRTGENVTRRERRSGDAWSRSLIFLISSACLVHWAAARSYACISLQRHPGKLGAWHSLSKDRLGVRIFELAAFVHAYIQQPRRRIVSARPSSACTNARRQPRR